MKARNIPDLSSLVSKVVPILVIIFGLFALYFFIRTPDKNTFASDTEKQENNKDLSGAYALGEGQSVTKVSSDTKKYTHSTIGFSFVYPASFTISSFGSVYDASGETVLLQDKGKNGIQVLITPFDEDIKLTAARIHKDIPSMEMTEVKIITIGGSNNSVQAVAFKSNNSLMGKSREVWFVKDKRLYQISAPQEIGDSFDGLISSWKF